MIIAVKLRTMPTGLGAENFGINQTSKRCFTNEQVRILGMLVAAEETKGDGWPWKWDYHLDQYPLNSFTTCGYHDTN